MIIAMTRNSQAPRPSFCGGLGDVNGAEVTFGTAEYGVYIPGEGVGIGVPIIRSSW